MLLAVALAAVGSLFVTSSAFAVYDHSELQAKVPTGCAANLNAGIADIAVDEGNQWIYVYCIFTAPYKGGYKPDGKIYRVSYGGSPANFSAVKPYVSRNQLIGNPGAANGSFETGNAGGHIAVDNSGGPTDGLIYILPGGYGVSFFTGSENIQIFDPSGEYLGAIVVPSFESLSKDVAVGREGSVYYLTGDRLSKYGAGYNEVARMYFSPTIFGGVAGNTVAVDGKGAIWIAHNGAVKYEPDQLFTDYPSSFSVDRERFTGVPSPFTPVPPPGASLTVDPSGSNDLYVNLGNKIQVFSEGNATEPTYASAPAFGLGDVVGPGIEVTQDHLVFTTAPEQKISRFGPGQILPNVHTHQVDVDHIGHISAELDAGVELDGGTPVTSCQLQIGKTTTYSSPPVPCTPSSFGVDSTVKAEPTGLETGTTYHYRFKVTNEKGTNFGADRSFVPAFVLKVKTLPPAPIAEHEVTLRGSLDPDGKATEYLFEYGLDENYDQQTTKQSAGSGMGVTSLGAAIQGLPSGKEFHYRIVATSGGKTTVGEDQVFRTASPPDITGVQATDLTETAATLKATINPVGYQTEYRFEYGRSTEYGSSIPAPDKDIGSGTEPVEVEQRITGLTPGTTYHFRVVATNVPWGKAVSPDTTFDFAPPACPNDNVRQETAASYLPDCRAYELVSPGAAGAVQLFPSQEVWDKQDYYIRQGFNRVQDPLSEKGVWALNNGLASGRFIFYGLFGTVNGLAAPNVLIPDAYLATRTSGGWVTTLPGLDDHYGSPSGKECSNDMDLCLEYNGDVFSSGAPREARGYLYTAAGKLVERLPSTGSVVPGANEYRGFRRTSGDFTNYAFSSTQMQGNTKLWPGVAFTPEGQTTGAGSAYDNDLEHRSVKLISRLPGGGMIPQVGPMSRAIHFPAISTDGSHILMLKEGGATPGPPYHLYMSVDDALFYDVSKGIASEFVGMTSDGTSVTFTSAEKLTADDTDNSVDLYRWHLNDDLTDSLTLLSVGNGNGNEDECAASWITGCGVEVPVTERRYALIEGPYGPPTPYLEAQGLDDVTAETSGDVYFYSPELLDGTRFGIPNQRNLYVAHPDGTVQLVATMDIGTEVKRMTVSRDGRYAAFLTRAKLTTYDNRGLAEVYVFDSQAETLECASCRPGGTPTRDAVVSQGGKFMSDDGRVFFATKDSLVPRDKNGEISDVYEYVGGRPQLISGALASRDYTGETELLAIGAEPETTGLEAVSRDGTDVFFSTYATLVDEDLNGQYVKFYDARTGGGSPQGGAPAPCAAADECHGADSVPPATPTVTSGTNLGTTGNVAPEKQAKKKAKHKKHKKNKKAKHKKKADRRGAGR